MYKGYEEATGKAVLLKVLTLEAANDPVLVDWFEHEAKSVASVDHPNVVALHRAGSDENGRPYLVTEYVEGASLEEVLAQHGSLPPELVAYVGAEIAAGLAAAHGAGILHRDLKPSNVLLGADGAVKLTDFGLATRLVKEPAGAPAEVRGTPGYLAPETVLGEEAGPAADLFALGATLVEALTGHRAFPAEDVQEALHSALNHDPIPLLKVDPRVPKPLRSTIEALLNLDAEARTTADETAAALRGSAILPGAEGGEISAELLATFLESPRVYQANRPVSIASPQPQAINNGVAVEAIATRHGWLPQGRTRFAYAASMVLAVIAMAVFVVSQLRPVSPAIETVMGSDLADSLVVDFQERPLDTIPSQLPSDGATTANIEQPRVEEGSQFVPLTPQTALEAGGNTAAEGENAADPTQPAVEDQPTARPGRLTVAVQPWAEVFVDDRKVGEGSRVDIEQLAVGSHQIRLRNPEFPDVLNVVQISPGSDERLAVSLWAHVARVTLQVHPWASVTLDGQPIGDVPPERTVIMQPGSHSIRLTHPQLGTWSGTVRVSAGERRTLPYNLARLLGQPDD